MTLDARATTGAAACGIVLGHAAVSATGAGAALSLDTSTADNQNAGAISLGSFSNAGSEFLQTLAVDATAGAGGTAGDVTFTANVRTTGNQDYTGPAVLAANTSLTGVDVTFSTTVSLAANNLILDVSGSSSTVSGAIGGTDSVTKQGSGTATLDGANTHTGATNVSAGTLLVNGSTASGSAVTVAGGATLGGTGTVHGTVTGDSGGTRRWDCLIRRFPDGPDDRRDSRVVPPGLP